MANYLTLEDEQNYGRDLLDVAQRAALHTVSPMLDQLAAQNTQLQRQLSKEQRHRMDQAVEAAVPNFREIDRNPRWHRWLLGIDPLSSRPRQALLNDAIAKGNAPRAIEFFRRFQQEEAGGTPQAASNRQAGSYYGRKPVYTPQQIKELYEHHRKGAWAGREADWNRLEADIFAAQKENRVRTVPYLTK